MSMGIPSTCAGTHTTVKLTVPRLENASGWK
jgi:hypothetical protein